MAKFLYLQDFHFAGKNSTYYLGDYFQDCLIMLNEILLIAKEHKIEEIFDGGDLLHTPEPSYRILDEIADTVEQYKIHIYSLFGNHAQRYKSNEHSQYTGLAHLFKRSKYFHYLNELQTMNYRIKGYEYTNNIENDLKENGIDFGNGKCWKIAIVHGFICPKEFPFATHVVCDEINTNADVVLVAHYHNQWEKKVGNTLFKDIGCIGRRSITERNILPSVLIIDTDNRTLTEIPLKTAKPASEIFDLSKVEELKDKEHTIDNFIKSIEDVQYQEMSIKDTIQFLAKEKNVSKEVVDLLLEKLT